MSAGLFVTGTDTGIGKTWMACGLLQALQQSGRSALGMKPVASGCERGPQGLRNADALALQQAASFPADYDTVNPYAFEAPIAPHLAAQECGVEIRFDRILANAAALAEQADRLIVEGVGGWRVPLGDDGEVADLARALGLPVVLVVGVRLGCLNHALLSAAAITASGLPLAGWIANLVDPQALRRQENVATLRAAIAAPCLGVVPFQSELQPATLAAYLELPPLEQD